MDNDLLSVIVPCYNVEKYVKQCLDSIINQTYTNLEIILIDDGSTDSTGQILDGYAQTDKRIVVVHQNNVGLAATRKVGIELAQGKYVGFVDSDDWIEAGMYEFLYKKIRETNAQVVTTARYIDCDGESNKCLDLMAANTYHPIKDPKFCHNMIYAKQNRIWGITPNFWNKLFVTEWLKPFLYGVNNDITYGEDDACVFPCMAYADTVSVTTGCFYHYNLRSDSMSASSDDKYFLRVNLLYLALKTAFEKHPFKDILIDRLDLYMFEFAIRGINKLWGIKTKFMMPSFVFPILDKKKIVLYGAGNVGKSYYQQLKFFGGG